MKHNHTIKVVAKRSGLSPHLIRMWERRYGAVNPGRTETGRRLYSDEDIERLTLLRQATLVGESIGQIANLTLAQLADLLPETTAKPDLAEEPPPAGEEITQHLKLCLDSIENLDSVNLEARLLRASIALGQERFLESILQPLLSQTGQMWADGKLKVAHEHLASAVIRSLLGSLYVSSRGHQSGPLLISTTPIGQLHEFGALMVAVTAVSSGWRAIYLGPNLPAEEIAAAAEQGSASVVALSLIYPENDPRTVTELKKLKKMLPAKTAIMLGGRAAGSYAESLADIDPLRTTSLVELRRQLEQLRRNRSEQLAG